VDVYLYQAALYCEDCGRAGAEALDSKGVLDEGDADGYPQGPYPDGGGEADSPQHCGAGDGCVYAEVLDGRSVGVFLENPLTDEGRRHVATQSGASELVRKWRDFYGIDPAGFPAIEATHIETWFERDRGHLALYDSRTGAVLAEWWDDDLRADVEDGFLDPRDYHGTAYGYAAEMAAGGQGDEDE
jgi:hypothetical protein